MGNNNGENLCEKLQSIFTQLVKQLQSRSGDIPEWSKEALSSISQVQPTPESDQIHDTRIDDVGKKRVICHQCKRPGHVKKNCFELVGYPSGWQQRQMSRSNFGKSYEKNKQERSGIVAEAIEEFEAKLMTATSEGADETAGSHDIEVASWIIDSGATNHMTGSPRNFSSYVPRSGKDRVRIADGSSAPIMGSGTIDCTSPLPLSLVLHVPNFPVNLLSVSSITKQLNCRVVFEPEFCVFQDLKSGKVLGTGTERDGLYYLNNVPIPLALSTKYISPTDELLLLHSRLGHPSFQSLSLMFPSLFASCCKDELVCEVCELAKHTRTNYPSSNDRSKVPFEVVHSDVWGPSAVTSLLGERWNSAGKFDPRPVKCIFVGYSPTQKGYRCWCPSERRFFVSMDVTFHEKEPFYSSDVGISHGVESKGENKNIDIVPGNSVLIPMLDMSQPGTETMGEDNTCINEENELCDIPPHQPVIEPDIPAPSSPRVPLHELAIHDGTGGEGDLISIPEDNSLPREHTQDTVEEGNDEKEIEQLKRHLAQEFEIKDLGQLRYFLGIEVSRGPQGIYLSQRKYVLDLLAETGMSGCRPSPTPIEQNNKLVKEGGSPVDREHYQRLVGRLIYLSHTRPDIAFAVSLVSQFMHDPRTHHMDSVMRIIRYVKGCPGRGLIYKSHGNLQVECFTDADWAGSLDDRRSTSGYCTFVGGNLVTWRSKKQSVVARSTAEAEFRAMSHGICEVLWLRILLLELGVFQSKPLMLYCDNKAALDIANNPVQHGRTKHIEIDRHFIKEKLDQGIICMPYVSSSNQVADILTKGLAEKVFSSLCCKMGLYDVFAPS